MRYPKWRCGDGSGWNKELWISSTMYYIQILSQTHTNQMKSTPVLLEGFLVQNQPCFFSRSTNQKKGLMQNYSGEEWCGA